MKLLIFFLFISVTSFSQTVEIVEPYIRGSLVNGVPKGRWEICDSVGAPGLIVDYSTGKIHFRGVDTSKFLVKEEDGTWQWESLQTPARFFGSIAKLQSHYLKFLADVRFNKIVWLVFEIDIDGKAKKPIIAGEAPNWVQNRIIEAFTLAPNDWIAGISNNKTVKTRVSIPIVNCREDCNDVIEQLKNPLVEHGKALFTISLNSSPTIRFKSPGSNLNSIVTRNALFYFGENEILWSNDDSRILVKSKGIDGTTTQIIKSDSFTVEKTIFSTYHYLIKCNSEDCSEVIINYGPGLPRDLIANFSIENGAFDIISYSHDILPIPSPSFSSIAFIRRDGQTQLLHTYNKQAGITNYSKCFAGSDIRPLAWSSESELICLIGDLLSSQLEIFDLKGCKRKSLSISNFSFVGLSPDLKKMLVQQKDRIESISKLLLFDIDTNESKFLTKSFKLITSAGWLNSDEVYYSYGKKTYAVSINDQHERVLNNLSSPIVSSKGDRLVYYNRSNNGIYVAKIDGSNPVLILQLKKEKQ